MEIVKSEVMLLAPVQRVWERFTEPKHITKWFFALQNWRSPRASNTLREGGTFDYRMEAKDGSFGYDFRGTIQQIQPQQLISTILEDGRAADFTLEKIDESTTKFTMKFQPETKNTLETQKRFWDIVLTNFEKYVEDNK